MTQPSEPRDEPGSLDEAVYSMDRALDALGRVPKVGQQGVVVDGIAHELRKLAARLRALRDGVAEGDRVG